MKKVFSWFLGAILVISQGGAAYAQACRDPDVVRVAVIPQIQNQQMAGRYDVLIQALQTALERNVVLMPVGSYSAVIEGVLKGSIDLAELGPASYARAKKRGAAISAFATLYRSNEQQPTYHSVLIVRHDSGIRSLEDLQGKALSLVDPLSTSGSLVPRAAIQNLTGMTLDDWFGRVSFAGSHDLAIAAVLSERVAGAFVSDTRIADEQAEGGVAGNDLRVLWRSESIPSDPFVYQNDLCEFIKQDIRQVFFERQDELSDFLLSRNKQGFMPIADRDYLNILSPLLLFDE